MTRVNRYNITLFFLLGSLAGFGLILELLIDARASKKDLRVDSREVLAKVENAPLSFIENRGQTDPTVSQYLQTPGKNVYFMKDGHIIAVTNGTKSHKVKVELLGAQTQGIEGTKLNSGVVSYFKGKKDNWKTDIPTNGSISYSQPWPGIDLSYNGTDGRLESVYTVAPHTDPDQIKLRYSGQNDFRLDTDGSLVYATSVGTIKETAPVAWQEKDGQRFHVETSFKLVNNDTVGFHLGSYDPDRELIIDPTLEYASYIGGSSGSAGVKIAVDASGNSYIVGTTGSTEISFPVTTGPDMTYNGGNQDVFIAKFDASGTSLIYAGYIGGADSDAGTDIAVDGSGNAYVSGYTSSTESTFPVSIGPDLSYNGGPDDAFVAKINATGTALTYCGYVGGSDYDEAIGIAIDGSGNAYLTGTTGSNESTFPISVGPDTSYNGGFDTFVAKVNASGTALMYAGYIGGNQADFANGIAVDSSGNALVTGLTTSNETTFPVTVGPDLTYNLNTDIFVAKVNSSGSSLNYAGYIGGTATDEGFDIAVDSSGAAYITGRTSSHDTFPVSVGPDLVFNQPGSFDAFVAKVNPSGNGLTYAGFIGGDKQDYGFSIAVDNEGSAYVSGRTDSTEATFPVALGPDLVYNCCVFPIQDGFAAKVNPSGTGLVYASYVGGDAGDLVRGIAVDSGGNAYLTGYTESSDIDGFSGVPGFDKTRNGGGDAFVAKISAQAAYVTVGGVVTRPGGQALSNTTVKMTDPFGTVRTATTSSFGIYSFSNVEAGATYSIVPNSKRYRFATQVLTIRESVSNVNFEGLE